MRLLGAWDFDLSSGMPEVALMAASYTVSPIEAVGGPLTAVTELRGSSATLLPSKTGLYLF